MATTGVLSGLELIKWQREFMMEATRESGFKPYMGTSETDIIRVVNDLKAEGETIRCPMVLNLKADGVSGNQRLSGNEEQMDQYYDNVSWEYYRQGVETSKRDRDKTPVDLLATKRPLLRQWAAEKIKYQLVDSFHSLYTSTAVPVAYTDASEPVKDAWLASNSDRVLFGNAVSNHSSNDHSAALANVDATADKLTADSIHLMKRRARGAYPRIKPYKTSDGRDFYVVFTHPRSFRDLKKDDTIAKANREARPRDVSSNPIFQDGDIIYDGIIFREIPELEWAKNSSEINPATTLVGVGNAASDVAVSFLCGAQALAYANKQAPMPVMKEDGDYNFFKGVAIEMAHGIKKMSWNNGAGARKDVGLMTLYFSGSADT